MREIAHCEIMIFLHTLKNIIRKLDIYSPYPVGYRFIMSKNERGIFDGIINKSRNYLEFGLGGSTIRALQKSKANIYTVDSSLEWIAYMRQYLIFRYFENKRLFIFPVDIGPTCKWGHPESDDFKNRFDSYSSNVFKLIDAERLDLVLVDGRFRVACTLKCILECHNNDDLKILIHDFWNREHYHVVLKYLDVVDKVDTTGIFSIKNNTCLKSVMEDYKAYKTNPR